MRVVLVSERPTLIDVRRDSDPVPGEKPVGKVSVETNEGYHAGRQPTVVGAYAHVSAPRLQQFLVEKSPEADRLIAELKKGPIRPNHVGVGVIRIDLDRIKR